MRRYSESVDEMDPEKTVLDEMDLVVTDRKRIAKQVRGHANPDADAQISLNGEHRGERAQNLCGTLGDASPAARGQKSQTSPQLEMAPIRRLRDYFFAHGATRPDEMRFCGVPTSSVN